jgi:hypothetical protein
MKVNVIFDDTLPPEKINEGINVLSAMLSGACNDCPYFVRRESEDTFVFPADAPCMREEEQNG